MEKKKIELVPGYCDLCGDRLPPCSPNKAEGVSLICPKCLAVLQAVKKMTDAAANAAEDNMKQQVRDSVEEIEDAISDLRSVVLQAKTQLSALTTCQR